MRVADNLRYVHVDLHGHGLCYVSVLQGMFLYCASAGIGRRRRKIEDSWQDYRRPSECSDVITISLSGAHCKNGDEKARIKF